MKKGIIGFLVIAVCLSMLSGCGKKTVSVPSDVSVTKNPTSSDDELFSISSILSDEELQMLRDLQFDDYRHMTIAEFQNKVWKLTDTPEYSELLSRLSKEEALYELRDSDETAAFLFYVLEPLTAEKWQSHTFSGAAVSNFPAWEDNARLEYTYTLTILAADKVKVKDYCNTREGVSDAMNSMMLCRSELELQSEEFMQAEIKTFVERLLPDLQTPELAVSVEFAYFPLSAEDENPQDKESDGIVDQEQRLYANGTERDYQSLLALKTPDYQDMSLADFNAALLAFANENHERMERIDEDDRFDDFKVPLSEEERSFIELTVFLSGIENAKAVQSAYTGEQEGNPGHEQYLPMRMGAAGGRAGWCCLYYQFTWHISDKETATVLERDHQISGMMNAVCDFWDETDMEVLLKMSESDIVTKLGEIASDYSTSNIIITISEDSVNYECEYINNE